MLWFSVQNVVKVGRAIGPRHVRFREEDQGGTEAEEEGDIMTGSAADKDKYGPNTIEEETQQHLYLQ
ncbi:hypothetical protein CesoFtcFv8_000490 [Champsocephalus esox]|uniref:Uncharacterized protein n=2 Tax=Champsocephalus TaxID=52236 RepID=A0AAN8I0Q0_CHAGU|nr:hypothetical protein CesoFtcFv8_000490 [Champsocephalus esox]KAK5934808.1 hypothetical protein CgunFtcFv8_020230 [Champsocephalus gunnari]